MEKHKNDTYHSVATLLLAMAEPHPNVLKQLSTMLPSSSTCVGGCVAAGRATSHYLDLQLHNVAACRGANQASAHVGVGLVKSPNVARAFVVIHNLRVDYGHA